MEGEAIMVDMVYPAVFLDRDGTINRDVPYCSRPEDLELLPYAGEAIRILNKSGFKVVVITNQSGIARGYFSEENLQQIHKKMEKDLAFQGAYIDAIYYCSHHPDKGCNCRKPKTGLLVKAVQDLYINIKKSFLVGDSPSDIAAGNEMGCFTIRIMHENTSNEETKACFTCNCLYQAALYIIRHNYYKFQHITL